MITKESKNRSIPKMMVDLNQVTSADLVESLQFQESVFYETYNSIKNAVANKKQEAHIFEINTSGTLIILEKDKWVPALESVIKFHAEKDNFEMCIEIKELQNKLLHEQPRKKRRTKESV
jgi:hypothetical protein